MKEEYICPDMELTLYESTHSMMLSDIVTDVFSDEASDNDLNWRW